jgi:hypothetical protein
LGDSILRLKRWDEEKRMMGAYGDSPAPELGHETFLIPSEPGLEQARIFGLVESRAEQTAEGVMTLLVSSVRMRLVSASGDDLVGINH